MIVADTNLIAYLFLEGEFTSQAELVYQWDCDWIAPYLWQSEFRNILALYIRKKIISIDKAQEIISQAEVLLEDKEFRLDSTSVLNLIVNCNLSAYDCEYVLLAQKLNIKLVTNDKTILRLFPDITVNLRQFSS